MPHDDPTLASHQLGDPDKREWFRHPGDIARLVWRSGLLALMLAVTALAPAALRSISGDIVRLFSRIPDPVRYSLAGIAQMAIIGIPLIAIAWLVARRTLPEVALVVGAAAGAALVMVLLTDWLNRAAPPLAIDALPSDSFISTTFPSTAYLAALVAGAAAASPLMNMAWRRIAWFGIALTVGVRVLTATQAPVNVAVTLALGGVIGSLVLVSFGAPQRRPGADWLRATLAEAGLLLDDVRPDESSAGRRNYQASAGGRDIVVAYVDRDDRDAALLARFVRSIRVHSLDEHNLSAQPRHRVEHEALACLTAEAAGCRVPRVEAVVATERDRALIALTAPSGSTLEARNAQSVGPAALDDLWRQLGLMHAAHIAHRSLSPRDVVLDEHHASLVGLANARLAATPEQCALDDAELLVSTALVIGPERAVEAAVRVAPRAELKRALPFVQPAALAPRTRSATKQQKGLIAEVREELQRQLGVEAVEIAPLQRISVAKIVSWVGFAVLGFFLLALITSWPDIRAAMRGINWSWVIPIVLATGFGTVGGAMSLAGSVLRTIALGEATVIMFGQSFLNRFTPMNAGGMAMRVRYLQKGGTDATVAVAAIGLTSAASGVVQLLFIGFFLLWNGSAPTVSTGNEATTGFDGPVVMVLVFAAVVAAGVVALTPALRRWLTAFVRSTIRKITTDFGALARRPGKLSLLFGGAAIVKLATIAAFVFSCRAFGIGLSAAELGALYLLATTAASAIPTPGGVGAVEAALVFVLTNAGIDDATAWAATLLFRLVNYWFPTIPGYVALRISERRELV